MVMVMVVVVEVMVMINSQFLLSLQVLRHIVHQAPGHGGGDSDNGDDDDVMASCISCLR